MKQQLGIYFVIFMIGLGAGYALTPEYAQMKAEKLTPMAELGQADAFLDLRYVNGMIAHHLSAIDMAKKALVHSKRPEILDLAQVIITSDERGIQQLYDYKRAWYSDTQEVKVYEKNSWELAMNCLICVLLTPYLPTTRWQSRLLVKLPKNLLETKF